MATGKTKIEPQESLMINNIKLSLTKFRDQDSDYKSFIRSLKFVPNVSKVHCYTYVSKPYKFKDEIHKCQELVEDHHVAYVIEPKDKARFSDIIAAIYLSISHNMEEFKDFKVGPDGNNNVVVYYDGTKKQEAAQYFSLVWSMNITDSFKDFKKIGQIRIKQ